MPSVLDRGQNDTQVQLLLRAIPSGDAGLVVFQKLLEKKYTKCYAFSILVYASRCSPIFSKWGDFIYLPAALIESGLSPSGFVGENFQANWGCGSGREHAQPWEEQR